MDFHCCGTAKEAPAFAQEAQAVTRSGFDLVVSVRPGARLWELESVWIEVPADEKHRDVLVGAWDSGKMPGKPGADGGVESPFFAYKNFVDDGGPVKDGARSVVTWLSGFALGERAGPEPFGVKVRGESEVNEAGEAGAVVSFGGMSGRVRQVPRSVRVSFLSFVEGDAAGVGLSRVTVAASFPNQETKAVINAFPEEAPVRTMAGVDGFQYLAKTEAIRLRVVDRQRDPDETKYLLQSWEKPLVHDLSAPIVKISVAE